MRRPAMRVGIGRRGRFRWRLDSADLAGRLGPVIDAFPEVDALPGARRIKENAARTVVRISVADGSVAEGSVAEGSVAEGSVGAPREPPDLIVKVYRYRGAWDRLRYALGLRHRALQEYAALGRLAALGLPVPRRLAVAVRRSGPFPAEGGLIVAFLPGAVSLADALGRLSTDASATAAEARSLLADVGRILRRLHDAAVWHRDLHAGNVLLSSGSASPPPSLPVQPPGTLHLIDVHSAVFLPFAPGWVRIGGLAKLVQSLPETRPSAGSPPEEPAAIDALLEGYGLDAIDRRGSLPRARERVLARVARLERRRLESRSRRCFIESTRFSVDRSTGRRGSFVTYRAWDLAPDEIEGLLSPPLEVPLAEAPREGPRRVVRHARLSVAQSLLSLLRPHELRRRYAGGHALSVRGVPSARSLALRERRYLGLVREAWLVSEEPVGETLEGFLLARYWRTGPPGRALARAKHRIIASAGRLLRRLHDAGIDLRRLSPSDLVVVEGAAAVAADSNAPGNTPGNTPGVDGELVLLSVDLAARSRPLSPRRRARDLVRLAALPEGHVGASDLLRGLRAYAGGDARWWARPSIERLRRELLRWHLGILRRAEGSSLDGDAWGERAVERPPGGAPVRPPPSAAVPG